MKKIFVVYSDKGGAGKTTTTLFLIYLINMCKSSNNHSGTECCTKLSQQGLINEQENMENKYYIIDLDAYNPPIRIEERSLNGQLCIPIQHKLFKAFCFQYKGKSSNDTGNSSNDTPSITFYALHSFRALKATKDYMNESVENEEERYVEENRTMLSGVLSSLILTKILIHKVLEKINDNNLNYLFIIIPQLVTREYVNILVELLNDVINSEDIYFVRVVDILGEIANPEIIGQVIEVVASTIHNQARTLGKTIKPILIFNKIVKNPKNQNKVNIEVKIINNNNVLYIGIPFIKELASSPLNTNYLTAVNSIVKELLNKQNKNINANQESRGNL